MYHDMIDDIADQLGDIEREAVKGASMVNGWICLDMKDGSKKQLIQAVESLTKSEFDQIAGMIFSQLKSKPLHVADGAVS